AAGAGIRGMREGWQARGTPRKARRANLIARVDDAVGRRRCRTNGGNAMGDTRISVEAFAGTITLADLERDPYPIYRRLRDQAPVAFVPAVDLWLVTRWEDAWFVDHHPELFTAATEPSTLNRTMGVNMLGSEGPAHERIRGVVEAPFRPR